MHRRPAVNQRGLRGIVLLITAIAACIGATSASAHATRSQALPREQTLYVGRTGTPLVPNGNPLISSTASDSGLRQGVFE